MNSKRKWYVLYIKPKKEDIVRSLLKRIGIETFYPKIRIKTTKGEKIEPMFPLYMFAKFSIPEDFINVKFCRGVRKIVHFGPNIPHIPDDIIDYLKLVSEQSVFEKKIPYKTGELVKIVEGPFRGLVGEIVKTDDKNRRVALLLKTASLCPTITLPHDYLEPIAKH